MRRRNQYEFPRCRGANFEPFNNIKRRREREFGFNEHERRQRFVFRRFLVQFRDILDGASRVPDNISQPGAFAGFDTGVPNRSVHRECPGKFGG